MHEETLDDLDLQINCLRQTLGVLMRQHCHQAHGQRYAVLSCFYCQELRTAARQASTLHDTVLGIPVHKESC